MMLAPIPADEIERLTALRDLLILDTRPEERFDRIVNFAAHEFDVPIALVSLVDDKRQWFKARVGVDVCETSRDISFCGHAVAAREALVVEDAWLDPRFSDNPLVVGAPHVRFYAGERLVLPSGRCVGTVCLIDSKPRTLDPMERMILGNLATLVVDELIMDRAEAQCAAMLACGS